MRAIAPEQPPPSAFTRHAPRSARGCADYCARTRARAPVRRMQYILCRQLHERRRFHNLLAAAHDLRKSPLPSLKQVNTAESQPTKRAANRVRKDHTRTLPGWCGCMLACRTTPALESASARRPTFPAPCAPLHVPVEAAPARHHTYACAPTILCGRPC